MAPLVCVERIKRVWRIGDTNYHCMRILALLKKPVMHSVDRCEGGVSPMVLRWRISKTPVEKSSETIDMKGIEQIVVKELSDTGK